MALPHLSLSPAPVTPSPSSSSNEETGTMKAAVLVAYNAPWEVREVPIPSPAPSEILVRTGAASYCHSDTEINKGYFKSPCPMIAGHESAGTVAAVGSEVKGFQVGDRIVALQNRRHCHNCEECTAGRMEICLYGFSVNLSRGKDRVSNGLHADGTWAEYQLVEYRLAVHLPSNISFEMASPLTCGGATIFAAIRKANLKPGQWLGVIGLGGLGALGVQFAKMSGLKVVAVDSRQSALDVAAAFQCPPDFVINSETHPKPRQTRALPADFPGLDAVINATSAPEAVRYGTDLLKNHGLFIATGMTEYHWTFTDLVMRDIRVLGSRNCDRHTFRELIELVAKDPSKVEQGQRYYKLGQINDLVEDAHNGVQGKLVILFESLEKTVWSRQLE